MKSSLKEVKHVGRKPNIDDDKVVINYFNNLDPKGIQLLSAAIVEQACKDVNSYRDKDCYAFFNSEWFKMLMPNTDGPTVYEQIKKNKSSLGSWNQDFSKLDRAKKIIRKHHMFADQIYCTESLTDKTEVLYDHGGLKVNISKNYGYFEVIGLNEEDYNELLRYMDFLIERSVKRHKKLEDSDE